MTLAPAVHPRPPDATVPCAGCTACCRNALIFMLPEHGDRHELYDCFAASHPFTGEPSFAIKQKENGDCAHLGEHGCEVYDRRPVICRTYDCRDFLRRFGDRHAQRRAVRDQKVSPEIYKAGRQRMPSLLAEERAAT